MNISWIDKSRNSKVGPIPVTASPRISCPCDCPLKGNECYGEDYRLRYYWNRIDEGTSPSLITWDQLCERVEGLPERQIWRHNQIGDLPKKKLEV